MSIPDIFEHWKPVVGYEDRYEISDHGRIRSLDRLDASSRRWKGRIMKQKVCGTYCQVTLTSGTVPCERRTWLSHRLVLEAFTGECPVGTESAHLDGNAKNNHISNLAWKTPKENYLDKCRHGSITRFVGEGHGMVKLSFEDVKRIRDLLACGATQNAVSLWFCVARSTIGCIAIGKTWSHA